MENEALSAAAYIQELDVSDTEEFLISGHHSTCPGIAKSAKRKSTDDVKEQQVPFKKRPSSKEEPEFVLLSCCMKALLNVQFMVTFCKGTLTKLEETNAVVEENIEKLTTFVSELIKSTTERGKINFPPKSSNLPPRKWTTAVQGTSPDVKYDPATCEELSRLVVNLMSSSSSSTRQLETLSGCIEGVRQTSSALNTFIKGFLHKGGKDDAEPADATQPQKGVSGIDAVALQVNNCWDAICSMDDVVKEFANRCAATDARINSALKFVRSLGKEREEQSADQPRVAGAEESMPKLKQEINLIGKDHSSSGGRGYERSTINSPFIKRSGNNVVIDVPGIYKTKEMSKESSCRFTEENLRQIEITVEAYEKMKNNSATWFARKLLPRFFSPNQTLSQCNFNTLGDELKVLLHVVELEFPGSTVGLTNMKRMRDGINAACREFKKKYSQLVQDVPQNDQCADQKMNWNQ